MAERTSALTAGGHKSICVYDGQLNLLARLESWVSLVWPERYNVYSGVQGAQLELHASTDLQALCRPDRYLWLTGSDRIMRICSAQTDRSEHKLVISARDAACILDERISTQTLSGFAVESTLRSLVSGAAALQRPYRMARYSQATSAWTRWTRPFWRPTCRPTLCWTQCATMDSASSRHGAMT